jgi:hypothetical protein
MNRRALLLGAAAGGVAVAVVVISRLEPESPTGAQAPAAKKAGSGDRMGGAVLVTSTMPDAPREAEAPPPAEIQPPGVEPETREQQYLRKYADLTIDQRVQAFYDLHAEVHGFMNEESLRYVASGMAEAVPEDEAYATGEVTDDTLPSMVAEPSGQYWRLVLDREDSPDLFEQWDEYKWLKEYVWENEEDDSDG